MKKFVVKTMERKTSFTREAVRAAILAVYAEELKTAPHKHVTKGKKTLSPAK